MDKLEIDISGLAESSEEELNKVIMEYIKGTGGWKSAQRDLEDSLGSIIRERVNEYVIEKDYEYQLSEQALLRVRLEIDEGIVRSISKVLEGMNLELMIKQEMQNQIATAVNLGLRNINKEI